MVAGSRWLICNILEDIGSIRQHHRGLASEAIRGWMRDGDVFQDLDGVISLVDFDQYHHPHLAVGALQPPSCIRPELSKGFWIPCLYNEDRP